ncbi:MAG: DUF4296 domain-containing protein [Prevotella sp.]|nr:DUF4296 domain-containing protein [Prevotella sp.]
MRFALCLLALLLVFSLSGCHNKKKLILSEREMENVLYDWHLCLGIVRYKGMDTLTERKYYNLVLEKHNITREQFDSSMVFYMTHADRMHGIYEHLSDRFTNLGRLEGVEADNLTSRLGLEGDTANIWPVADKHLFTSYIPDRLLRFRIPADTAFHPGDKFILSFRTRFLYQQGPRNLLAVISLRLNNDSVITRARQVSSDNMNTLETVDFQRIGAKEISGYFLCRPLTGNNEQTNAPLRLMVVDDIRLIKMHTSEPHGRSRAGREEKRREEEKTADFSPDRDPHNKE